MNKPPRGVVLCSGSASSLQFLSQHDPAFGERYQIVGLFSNVPDVSGLAFAKSIDIPTQVLDFNTWCTTHGIARNDLLHRYAYFAEILMMIRLWSPDFIVCSGFMLIVTDPLLEEFWGRMLNVHPALLSIMNEDGTRRYTGLNVVARAMKSGDPTGSTVHLLNGEPDMGPIVAESGALPYTPSDDPEQHQVEMKTKCDGPAYQEALKKLIDAGWPHVPWSQ